MTLYTHSTLAQLVTQLAERLRDDNKIFWTDGELKLYLVEALRTWAAATLPFRDRGLLTTVSGQPFYNVPSSVSGSLLSQTITDISLAREIEYHLIESVTSGAWMGTEDFTLGQVQAALQNRLNQFMLEVGFGYSYLETDYIPPNTERVTLSDNTIEVVRADWITPDGNRTPLWLSDGLQSQRLSPTYPQTSGIPLTFSVTDASPLTLSLAPMSADSGTLGLVAISTHTNLNLLSGVTLTIPDDLAWVVKWGALTDLLTAREDSRASYCEKRWREGIEIAKIYPSILLARIADAPATMAPLFDLDSLVPGWISTTGTPTLVAPVSYDLLALYPVPNISQSIVSLDVVTKAPIPTDDEDFVQVPREYLSILLDYAQHLALFKEGGANFAESIQYYDRMVQAASLQNERLKAQSAYFDALKGQTRLGESRQPRIKEES